MRELTAAITGLGLVSPLGIGYDQFAESSAHGVSGIDVWSGGGEQAVLAAEVTGFRVADYLVAEKTYLDRCSELALAAAKLCLDHAGLSQMPAAPARSGVVLGTQYGPLASMANYAQRVRQRGVRFATPLLFSHAFANTPASLVSIDFHLQGYHATVTSGPESGWAALHTALVALAAGHADALLAGGCEALCAERMAALGDDLVVTDDPDSYDPWTTPGTVPGEGAALLLLEPVAHAQARGATIHAVLSTRPDAGTRLLAAPDGRGGVTDCLPTGLWGDAAGAQGALACALAVVALQHGLVPPVRGGDDDLDTRREPLPTAATRIALGSGLSVASA
jgi:3-oxoacyl-[acyl-carrier-protein] synthase II